jgi:hypothetical protein
MQATAKHKQPHKRVSKRLSKRQKSGLNPTAHRFDPVPVLPSPTGVGIERKYVGTTCSMQRDHPILIFVLSRQCEKHGAKTCVRTWQLEKLKKTE